MEESVSYGGQELKKPQLQKTHSNKQNKQMKRRIYGFDKRHAANIENKHIQKSECDSLRYHLFLLVCTDKHTVPSCSHNMIGC